MAFVFVMVLAFLALSGSTVQASPAIDQQCSSIGGSYLDGVGVHEPAGQTFIPTQSSMTGFSLYLWSDSQTATSVTANIISNGIAGVNGIQGNVVGSATFTVPADYGQPTGEWLTVQLPSGIVLTPGAVYAINLEGSSGSGGIKWSACSTPYSNGCGYSGGQCQANSWAFEEYYGDFSLAFSTSGISIPQGASGIVTLYVGSLDNFASPVTVTYAAPHGVSASFNGPNQIQTSAGGTSSPSVTILVDGTVPAGTYPFTVTATSGGIAHSATLQLIVTPSSTLLSSSNPDFVAEPSLTVIALTPGSSGTATIAISSANGFSSSVSLAAYWSGAAPANVAVSLPSPVEVPSGGTATSLLTVSAGDSPSTGTYTLIVTASNGVTSHSTQIAVTIGGTPQVLAPVAVPDFSITPSSGTVAVIQGLSSSTTLQVNSLDGFSSPVTFSTSWVGNAPTGISVSLPQSVTPPVDGTASSPIGFTTTSTGSTGSFVLQVIGISGSLTHSTDITLQVNTSGPSCIIATATYGSSAAPEVQVLRDFRDESILKTRAGSSFMMAFNAWYYSFSPPVANYIANHWAQREAMQVILYPMIGILDLSYEAFNAANAYPEIAIILTGILASAMLGGFYLGLPIGILRKRVKRLTANPLGASLQRVLLVATTASVAALVFGELIDGSALLMVSSVTLVLSTMLLSATTVSNKIVQLTRRGRTN